MFETQVWGDCLGYFGKGQETKIGRGDFEIGQTNGTKLWNGGGRLAALLRAMSTLELSGSFGTVGVLETNEPFRPLRKS